MSWVRSIAVVERIASGAPAAEEEFAARFLPRVRMFLRGRGADEAWADELTQETLLACLKTLREGRLREAESLEAFVLGVARRQWAEACRRKARLPMTALGGEQEAAIPAPLERPEWTLTVRREFETLEPVNRRILWLILVEGYRPDEVASLVGMSGEVVRQRKSRALRRMGQKLGFGPVTTAASGTTESIGDR